MITDLSYDIQVQDWPIVDGDFVITADASVQNGGIILLTRAFSSLNTILGIGINQVRGSNTAQVNYEFNRWKQQVYSDNGRASVTTVYEDGVPTFEWEVNYD